MVRIASGTDGQVARDAAQEVLRTLGRDLTSMSSDELVIDVGRRSGGGSFWVVWLKEDLLPKDHA